MTTTREDRGSPFVHHELGEFAERPLELLEKLLRLFPCEVRDLKGRIGAAPNQHVGRAHAAESEGAVCAGCRCVAVVRW